MKHDFVIVVVATIAIGAVAEVMVAISRTQPILLTSAVMVGYSVSDRPWRSPVHASPTECMLLVCEAGIRWRSR